MRSLSSSMASAHVRHLSGFLFTARLAPFRGACVLDPGIHRGRSAEQQFLNLAYASLNREGPCNMRGSCSSQLLTAAPVLGERQKESLEFLEILCQQARSSRPVISPGCTSSMTPCVIDT